ncbi:Hypothetical predicted protein [Podarcis lilfordi]|uniref:Uncharacterized protein n=1 Tax=Podarcis lilfordi TaxID=74358 RepID=A0AA35PF61_9SAUR|nr:Hypothetical predicted protein [Podarcis lilfordi]
MALWLVSHLQTRLYVCTGQLSGFMQILYVQLQVQARSLRRWLEPATHRRGAGSRSGERASAWRGREARRRADAARRGRRSCCSSGSSSAGAARASFLRGWSLARGEGAGACDPGLSLHLGKESTHLMARKPYYPSNWRGWRWSPN